MNLLSRIGRKLRCIAYTPAIPVTPAANVVELGTEYGGWNFIDNGDLRGTTVISAGLGEDASFDVLFAATYGARLIMIDPTPRAIAHFRQIQARIGLPAETALTGSGQEFATAYDLSRIQPDSLVLLEKALWIRDEPVRFYQPANTEHVSHSITNLFNNDAVGAPYIEVPSITLQHIVRDYGLDRIAILKIDIEGVEVDVMTDMLEKHVHPEQILVEFDEISSPSRQVKEKYESCDRMLREAGYLCVFCKGGINFTYAKAGIVTGRT